MRGGCGMRLCELRDKEVINICSGRRLGCIVDVEINVCKRRSGGGDHPGTGKDLRIPRDRLRICDPVCVYQEDRTGYRDRGNTGRKIFAKVLTIVYNERRLQNKTEINAEKGGKNMRCPYCGNPDTRVIDSRPAEDKSSIRRRRSCDECGRRFTTYEKVETIPLIVIKKDNNREQYERSKIEARRAQRVL